MKEVQLDVARLAWQGLVCSCLKEVGREHGYVRLVAARCLDCLPVLRVSA